MSDLERIEKKHRESPVRGADDTRYCYEDDLPYPCDVVKLARALDNALSALMGDDPEGVESVYDEGKRTLKEVGGE